MKKLTLLTFLFAVCSLITGIMSGCLETHTHTLGEWQSQIDATCTESGFMIRYCQTCNFSESKTSEPLGHNFQKQNTVEPTFVQKGYSVYKCNRNDCTQTKQDDFTYLITFTHITQNQEIDEDDLPQTYTKVYKQGELFLGVENTNQFQVVGYKYDNQGQHLDFATNQPFTNSTHIIVEWDYLEAQNHTHTLGPWSTITPETCTTAEVLGRECTSQTCGYKETKPGKSALGHNEQASIVAPKKHEAGYTLHKCSRENCSYEYRDTYKYMISYVSISENSSVVQSELPTISEQIYNQNQRFMGVENTNKFFVVEYRNYLSSSNYVNVVKGDKFTYSVELTIVWEKVVDDAALQNVITRIEKLEEISEKYNTEKGVNADSKVRVLQYIRQKRYGDTEWNVFGGTIESDFSAYVQQNQGEYDLVGLQSLSSIEVPLTKEKVDFVHMIAIMNVVLRGGLNNNSFNDMVGWGGDLCQLVVELNKLDLTGTALQNKANELFNSKSSSFGDQDVCADLDAINLIKLYTSRTTKSLAQTMKDYYYSCNEQSRKTEFKQTLFNSYDSINSLTSHLVSRLSGNVYVSVWCTKNGIGVSKNSSEFYAAARAFATYLLS